jgi:hypothetical protein
MQFGGMRRVLASLLAVAAVLGPARAAGDGDIAGAGAATCAAFTEKVRTNGDPAILVVTTWEQGYMTGLNRALLVAGVPGRDLSAKTFEQETKFILDYCAAHPDEPFYESAQSLMNAFPPSMPMAGRGQDQR